MFLTFFFIIFYSSTKLTPSGLAVFAMSDSNMFTTNMVHIGINASTFGLPYTGEVSPSPSKLW